MCSAGTNRYEVKGARQLGCFDARIECENGARRCANAGANLRDIPSITSDGCSHGRFSTEGNVEVDDICAAQGGMLDPEPLAKPDRAIGIDTSSDNP